MRCGAAALALRRIVRCCAAHSYPAPLLSRAFNEFDAAICAYRNREGDLGRIIVVYDWDERIALVSSIGSSI
jgi:hypothetical protein